MGVLSQKTLSVQFSKMTYSIYSSLIPASFIIEASDLTRSMKVSLWIGRQWRRTRHTPAFVVHLMLGSCCLVSTMMQQTSHHPSSSVWVCSLLLSVTYTNWKSVLYPTTKNLYIKHYWAPQYQAIAMDNVHDIVSTLTLNLSYYWILSVSWIPWHSSCQSHARW